MWISKKEKQELKDKIVELEDAVRRLTTELARVRSRAQSAEDKVNYLRACVRDLGGHSSNE